MSANKRPLSPFMIGPYYRPQMTSVLSITHRATGAGLVVGTLLLVYWLAAAALGWPPLRSVPKPISTPRPYWGRCLDNSCCSCGLGRCFITWPTVSVTCSGTPAAVSN